MPLVFLTPVAQQRHICSFIPGGRKEGREERVEDGHAGALAVVVVLRALAPPRICLFVCQGCFRGRRWQHRTELTLTALQLWNGRKESRRERDCFKTHDFIAAMGYANMFLRRKETFKR